MTNRSPDAFDETEVSDYSERDTQRLIKPQKILFSRKCIQVIGVITLLGIIIFAIHHQYYEIDEDTQAELDYQAALYARDVNHNLWLIATIIPYYGEERRNIMRETWQKFYKRYNYTTRFVLARPSLEYAPKIKQENETYGDLIVLDHLEENYEVACKIKSMEFYRYLKKNNMIYTYVTRLDDDNFLNVPAYWDEYIAPNIVNPRKHVIARDMYPWNPTFPFPGGQLYTMSWDLLCLLTRLHSKNPIKDLNDDLAFGRLFGEAKEEFTIIDLPCYKSFDYNPRIDDVNKWDHMVTTSAVNPHKMKSHEMYVEVASMFDENGINPEAVDRVNARYEHNVTSNSVTCTQNITSRTYNKKRLNT